MLPVLSFTHLTSSSLIALSLAFELTAEGTIGGQHLLLAGLPGLDVRRHLAGGEVKQVGIQAEFLREPLDEIAARRMAQVVFEVVEVGRRDWPAILHLDAGRQFTLRQLRPLASLRNQLAECLHVALWCSVAPAKDIIAPACRCHQRHQRLRLKDKRTFCRAALSTEPGERRADFAMRAAQRCNRAERSVR